MGAGELTSADRQQVDGPLRTSRWTAWFSALNLSISLRSACEVAGGGAGAVGVRERIRGPEELPLGAAEAAAAELELLRT